MMDTKISPQIACNVHCRNIFGDQGSVETCVSFRTSGKLTCLSGLFRFDGIGENPCVQRYAVYTCTNMPYIQVLSKCVCPCLHSVDKYFVSPRHYLVTHWQWKGFFDTSWTQRNTDIKFRCYGLLLHGSPVKILTVCYKLLHDPRMSRSTFVVCTIIALCVP